MASARARTALQLAAEQVIAVQAHYAAAGVGLAQAALGGARRFDTLRHYPAGDVIDRAGHSQFYYHAHDSHRRPAQEHGHFHLFVRGGEPGAFFHLAALSLDAHGWPLRWFTTNRWVTGERWVDATTAIAAIPGFQPRAQGRLAPVARWLSAMVALHADALAALLRRRDTMVARRLQHTPAGQLYEDRRLDVITQTQVSLPRRLQHIAGMARPTPQEI